MHANHISHLTNALKVYQLKFFRHWQV